MLIRISVEGVNRGFLVSTDFWVRISRSVQLVSENRISPSLPLNIINVYT